VMEFSEHGLLDFNVTQYLVDNYFRLVLNLFQHHSRFFHLHTRRGMRAV